MHYYERLNESDGPSFCSFSVRCSLSNVDEFCLSVIKSNLLA